MTDTTIATDDSRWPDVPRIWAFLERRGWERYPGNAYEDEAWLLPGRIQFEGQDATAHAFSWQLQQDREAAEE